MAVNGKRRDWKCQECHQGPAAHRIDRRITIKAGVVSRGTVAAHPFKFGGR